MSSSKGRRRRTSTRMTDYYLPKVSTSIASSSQKSNSSSLIKLEHRWLLTVLNQMTPSDMRLVKLSDVQTRRLCSSRPFNITDDLYYYKVTKVLLSLRSVTIHRIKQLPYYQSLVAETKSRIKPPDKKSNPPPSPPNSPIIQVTSMTVEEVVHKRTMEAERLGNVIDLIDDN